MNIIKIKKINEISFISSSIYILESIDRIAVSFIKVITNTVKDENIEDRDEYRNISETISQVNVNSRLIGIDSAIKIPRYVATPFPPLNFNHIGKTCPKKARRHDN